MSLLVYPFPPTVNGILIRVLSLILGKMSFYPLASRQSLKWVEERFEEALTFCEGQQAVAHSVPQARADIRAVFKHYRALRKEEHLMIEAWQAQIQRTIGRHTPFFRPANWGQHRYYRWFERVKYCLTYFGMPNYRGPTIDELVLELGKEFAILPRGEDGKLTDNIKLLGLLEKEPPQYLLRRLNFHRLSQASLKHQMRLTSRQSSGLPSVDVSPIPAVNVEGPLRPYQNFDADNEPQYAPVHSLDLVYKELRETDAPVRDKLHPDLTRRGALVVNLHQDRVLPRSSSTKRSRERSNETKSTKRGKGGDTTSATATSASASGKAPQKDSGKSKDPKSKDPKSKDKNKGESAPSGRSRSKSRNRNPSASGTTSQAGSTSTTSQSTRGRGRGRGRGHPKPASGVGGSYQKKGW